MKSLKSLLKGIGAAVLAIAMAAALLPTAAMADATTYKLTLTGTATGHTYEVYQIFTGDLSVDETGNNKVLSNVNWGSGVTYTGSEATAADVAKKLGDGTIKLGDLISQLTLTTPAKTVTSTASNTEISGLAPGYYLVKDQDGTQDNKNDAYTKFIVQVVGNTEAAIKSGVPTVEKKVKDNTSNGGQTDWQDSADYAIGDTVPYQITGTMPENIGDYTTYKYVFTDTMSKGLTYTANTAKITIGTRDVTSSFTEAITDGENGAKVVTWACDNLKGIDGVSIDADTRVVVTYSATLNSSAVIGATGNPNWVNLTYSNNPNNGGQGDTGHTPDDKNIVFTYKLDVNKYDPEKKGLAGAAFKLEKKNADDTYTLVKEYTAGTDTTFGFAGLDAGVYKLTETTTPAGYNSIQPIEFTIYAEHEVESPDPKLTQLEFQGGPLEGETANASTGTLSLDVVNNKGHVLPSTGGMGTTILYVGGAAIAAAAAFGIHLLRRRSNNA